MVEGLLSVWVRGALNTFCTSRPGVSAVWRSFVAYRECDVVDPSVVFSSASSVWISPRLVSLLLIPLGVTSAWNRWLPSFLLNVPPL